MTEKLDSKLVEAYDAIGRLEEDLRHARSQLSDLVRIASTVSAWAENLHPDTLTNATKRMLAQLASEASEDA